MGRYLITGCTEIGSSFVAGVWQGSSNWLGLTYGSGSIHIVDGNSVLTLRGLEAVI